MTSEAQLKQKEELSKLLQPIQNHKNDNDDTAIRATAAEQVLQTLLFESKIIQSRDISNAVDFLLKQNETNNNNEQTSKMKEKASATTMNDDDDDAVMKDTSAAAMNNKNQTKTKSPPPPTAAAAATKTKKTPPPFSYRTRHIALKFLYNGASYTGLTQNIGANIDNSIEKQLFAALTKSCLINNRESSNYSRCGRTDKGVSAHGQVIALEVRSAIPPEAMMEPTDKDENGNVKEVEIQGGTKKKLKLIQEEDLPPNNIKTLACFVPHKKGKHKKNKDDSTPAPLQPKTISELNYPAMLNNLLPPSIRILGWTPVSSEFSARFSCTRRIYRYYFTQEHLNLQNMWEGLQLLKGKHDFRNFCKMDCERVYNFERRIYDVRLIRGDGVEYTGDTEGKNKDAKSENGSTTCSSSSKEARRQIYHIEIIGQAFLWHQIRCIMSILFLIGEKHESPSIITNLLDIESNPGKPSYDLASDAPLVLHDCQYENVTYGYSVENMWKVHCDLENQWTDAVILAERTRDGMDSLGTDVIVFYKDVKQFVQKMMEERKKKARRYDFVIPNLPTVELSMAEKDDETNEDGTLKTMNWNEALEFIYRHLSISPSPSNHKENIHIPIMKRFKGSTYEEKIASIYEKGRSVKRRQRYEENVVKKRKAEGEDRKFYETKIKAGGSGL